MKPYGLKKRDIWGALLDKYDIIVVPNKNYLGWKWRLATRTEFGRELKKRARREWRRELTNPPELPSMCHRTD